MFDALFKNISLTWREPAQNKNLLDRLAQESVNLIAPGEVDPHYRNVSLSLHVINFYEVNPKQGFLDAKFYLQQVGIGLECVDQAAAVKQGSLGITVVFSSIPEDVRSLYRRTRYVFQLFANGCEPIIRPPAYYKPFHLSTCRWPS